MSTTPSGRGVSGGITTITYETATGERVHSPLLEIGVEGQRTLMVIDTGATDHVFTRSLAEDLGLSFTVAEPGTDAAGGQVPSWAAGPVAVRLGEATRVLGSVFVIEGPPPFADWGIGGFLSPQLLVSEGPVVLDFARGELSLGHLQSSDVFRTGGREGLTRIPVERHGSGLLTSPITVATEAAMVEGIAFLDSGSEVTELDLRGVAGVAIGEGPGGASVGGTATSSASVEVASLRLGPAPVHLERVGVRRLPSPDGFPEAAPPVGLVGMDILRRARLVIEAGSAELLL